MLDKDLMLRIKILNMKNHSLNHTAYGINIKAIMFASFVLVVLLLVAAELNHKHKKNEPIYHGTTIR